jgi:hypothetical protein
MPLVFRVLHSASSSEALNDEWMILENTGPGPLTSAGCTLTAARHPHQRPRPLGTLDPGFFLQPNEKIRLVSGSPSKKAHGPAPDEKEMKNYHLFLREPVLRQAGMVVRITLKQLEMARAVFAPDASDGLAKAT